MNKRKFFTGNQLKIIAAIAMVIDHIGAYLFPHLIILRIIGRLAYPIFAYMIAEGFEHTKNRKKYLLRMVVMAMLLQLGYAAVMKSAYQCIFVTFSMSIALCMVADNAIKRNNPLNFTLSVVGVWIVTSVLPDVLYKTGFWIDYGFFGVMLPVVVFMVKPKPGKIIAFVVMLCLLWADCGGIQGYALASVPLVALYNGARGRLKIKNFFYIFYPAHIAAIDLLRLVVESLTE